MSLAFPCCDANCFLKCIFFLLGGVTILILHLKEIVIINTERIIQERMDEQFYYKFSSFHVQQFG